MQSTRRAVFPLLLVWCLSILQTQCGWLGDVSITPGGLDTLSDVDPNDPGTTPVTPGDGSGKRLQIFVPQPAVVGYCWPATISAMNNGIAEALTSDLALNVNLPSQFTGYSTSTCAPGSETSSANVATGTSSATIWFKSNDNGLYQISANVAANVYQPGVVGVQVNDNSGSALVPVKVVIAGPQSLSAGSCQAYVATFFNANNQNSSFTQNTTVLFNSTLGGGFHSAAGCSSATSSLVLPAGTSNVTVFFKSGTAGLTQLSASTGGLSGQIAVLVSPGAVSKLEVQGPAAIALDDCRNYLVVARDASNNVVQVGATLNVNLAVAANGSLFSDNSCANALTSASILAGNSSAGFYMRATQIGSANIVASASGVADGQLLVNVLPGGTGNLPARLAFVTPSTQTNAGICYGPIRMQIQDASGNNLPAAAPVTVALSDTGHGEFFSDLSCEQRISSASSSGQVYFRDYTAEATYLSGASSGLASANHALTIRPGPRYRIVLLANGQVFTAGGCHGLNVVYTDPYGNTTPVGVPSNVSLSDFTLVTVAPLKFYSDSSCGALLPSSGGSQPKQMAAFAIGEFQKRVYFKENVARVGWIQGSDSGIQPGEMFYELEAGAPERLVLTKAPTVVNVGDCAPFQYTFMDQLGNPSALRAVFDVWNMVTVGNGKFYSDNICATAMPVSNLSIGTSSNQVYYQTDRATPTQVTAEFEANGSGVPRVSHSFSISPSGATRVAVIGKASPMSPRGPSTGFAGTCLSLAARVEDSYGNPVMVSSVTNVPLNISSVAEGKFYSDAACTTRASSVTLSLNSSEAPVYFKGTGTGQFILSALIPGLTPMPYQVSLTSGAARTISFTGPSTTSVGVCTGPFELKGKDEFGNITALPNNTVLTLNGGGQGIFYSNSSCSTGSETSSVTVVSPAVAGQFYFKDLSVESLLVNVTAPNLGAAARSLVISVGAPSRIVFTGPSEVQEGVCSSALKFKVTDNYGNLIVNTAAERAFALSGDASIKFYSGACATEITEIKIAKDASQSSEFSFRSSLPGNLNIRVEQKPVGTNLVSGLWPVLIRARPTTSTVDLKAGIAPNYALSDGPLLGARGSQVKVKWTSTNANTCVFNPPVITGTATAGEQYIPLNQAMNLTLTCSGLSVAVDSVNIGLSGPCVQQRTANFEEFNESVSVGDLNAKYGMIFTGLAGGSTKIAKVVQQGQSEPAFRAWASILCPGRPNHNRVCNDGCSVGNRVLSLSSAMNTRNVELQVKFAAPVAFVSFDLIDADGSEKWTFTGYNEANALLSSLSVQKNGYGASSGNNAATRIVIRRPTADLRTLKLKGTKSISLFGFAMDNFTSDLPVCNQ